MSFREFLPYTPEDANYFQMTLSEIIRDAAGLIQVGVDGEDFAPEYYARSINVVNRCVLEMQAQGLHLTSYKVGYLFLQPNQYKYVIEDEHSTNEYWSRQIATAAVATDTVIEISESDDLEVDDTIGITLDDGSIQWTTVTAIDTVTPTVTIADALTGDAGEDNYIFNYRVALRQISRIHQILRRDNYVNDVPLNMISQQEWDTLNNKQTTGQPNQMYYQRATPKGILKMWPAPQNSTSIVWFWYEAKLGQMKDPTDILDMDQFYLPAFQYLVALRACDTFGASDAMKASIKMTYDELLVDALNYDDEGTPIKISPNRRI